MSIEPVVLKYRPADKKLTVVLEDFKKAINRLAEIDNSKHPVVSTAHDAIVQVSECLWKRLGHSIYFNDGSVFIGPWTAGGEKFNVNGSVGLDGGVVDTRVQLPDWAMGQDVSDANAWSLSLGSSLGTGNIITARPWDGVGAGLSLFTLSASWATPLTGTAESPTGLCTDGTYFYYSDTTHHQVVKVNLATSVEVARTAITTAFYPTMLTTDGTHVYVICAAVGDINIRKFLCSDMSYVATSYSWASQALRGLCYYGSYLYITLQDEYWATNRDIIKMKCSDLSTSTVATYAKGTGTNQFDALWGIATDGLFLYVLDLGNNNRIVKLQMDGTWVAAQDIDDYVKVVS